MTPAGPLRVALMDGEIDLAHRVVRRVDRVAQLTEQEAEIVRYLAARIGEDVERDALLTEVLGYAPTAATRAVDLAVRRLRAKIEIDPARPRHLVTVYGVGYRLVPGDDLPRVVRTNVPPPRDAMVGRDALVATGLQHLREDPGQPLWLVGPAGVGKTRVAHALARRAASSVCPAGAFLVDLANTEDPLGALAADAGLGLGLADPTTASLARAVAGRGPSLVVLDDADSASELATTLQRALIDAGVSVVATSRAAPEEGARALPVPPLSPEDAATLFVLRAQEATGRAPQDTEKADVARIVEGTDALPLALELAATRLRALSVAAIASALDRSLRLLRSGGEGRHASMEAALRMSWDALDDAGRDALTRLAVFRGGATPPAAGAVLGVEDPEAVLAGLHDRSLLHRDGAGRARLFHAVEAFARRHGDPEVLGHAARQHLAWLVPFAREQVSRLRSSGYVDAVTALAAEWDNLLAAMQTAMPEGGEAAGSLLEAISASNRGPWDRVLGPLTATVLPTLDEGAQRGRVLHILVWGEAHQGRWRHALETARRMRASADASGDRRNRVDAHRSLASCLATMGDLDAALQHARTAMDLAESEDERVRALASLGGTLFLRGELQQASAILRQAGELAVAREDLALAAAPLVNLGSALASLGDPEGAFAAWERAADVFQRVGRPSGYASIAYNRGWLRLLREEWEQAAADLELSADLALDQGYADRYAGGLVAAAVAVFRLGLPGEAVALARRALEQAVVLESRAPVCSSVLGVLLCLAGETHSGRDELLRFADDLAQVLGVEPSVVESLIAVWTAGADPARLAETLEAQVGRGREACTLHALLLRGSVDSA